MLKKYVILTLLGALASTSLCSITALQEVPYFCIRIEDKDTQPGIPLVEPETVHHLHPVTDNNGIIAFYEPGLMGREVYFHIRSHGYEYPADGFGYRGVRLKPIPGGKVTISLKRNNIAERLYRITGAGLYRDSILVKHPVPILEPLLNAEVLGQDSVLQAVYQGKIYWFWGDTLRLNYPLGNFQATGALSSLPSSDVLSSVYCLHKSPKYIPPLQICQS